MDELRCVVALHLGRRVAQETQMGGAGITNGAAGLQDKDQVGDMFG
jgi:hypothetical protein